MKSILLSLNSLKLLSTKFETANEDHKLGYMCVCVCARVRACVCARVRVCVGVDFFFSTHNLRDWCISIEGHKFH